MNPQDTFGRSVLLESVRPRAFEQRHHRGLCEARLLQCPEGLVDFPDLRPRKGACPERGIPSVGGGRGKVFLATPLAYVIGYSSIPVILSALHAAAKFIAYVSLPCVCVRRSMYSALSQPQLRGGTRAL